MSTALSALPQDPQALRQELQELYQLAKDKEQSSSALSILKYVHDKQDKQRASHSQGVLGSSAQQQATNQHGQALTPPLNRIDQWDKDYDEHQLDQFIFRCLVDLYQHSFPELAAVAQSQLDQNRTDIHKYK